MAASLACDDRGGRGRDQGDGVVDAATWSKPPSALVWFEISNVCDRNTSKPLGEPTSRTTSPSPVTEAAGQAFRASPPSQAVTCGSPRSVSGTNSLLPSRQHVGISTVLLLQQPQENPFDTPLLALRFPLNGSGRDRLCRGGRSCCRHCRDCRLSGRSARSLREGLCCLVVRVPPPGYRAGVNKGVVLCGGGAAVVHDPAHTHYMMGHRRNANLLRQNQRPILPAPLSSCSRTPP